MYRMRLKGLLIFMTIVAAGTWIYGWQTSASGPEAPEEGVTPTVIEPPPTSYVKSLEVVEDSTYGKLMEEAGVGASTFQAIFTSAEDLYDLSRVRLGRTIDLTYDIATDTLEELTYQIDTEEELHVRKEGEEWVAELVPIDYEVRVRTVEGTIESSLYASALEQGLDEKAVVALAEVFQWTIDFAMDVRVGDTYRFIYEERYRNGEYVMPGAVLAARYVNDGDERLAFYFEDGEGEWAHYDDEGESLQKLFLKAPVAFKYISSGFTTGRRYVAAFNTSTGHRAIDYAAAMGTPIRSVGDGTVAYSGWNGPYGNFVSIRHNGTYKTNYAHMSRRAVSTGQKVSQGQTIGYVGSTGFSTGPHLHYEMVKHGVKINPLRETFPSTEPVSEGNRDAFQAVVDEYLPQLR